ncbi:MAG: hypothetical protein AB8D78_01775 [Akkermansiaceae bacterium]
MISRLSIALLSIGIFFANLASGDEMPKNPMALLPDGSVMKGVLLPRYDENRRLIGDLKAEILTILDRQRIRGEDVLIRFYKEDGSEKGRVKMKNAIFDQQRSLLKAVEPIEITNDNLIARGTGLVYAFQEGKGFLRGPASTRITPSEPVTSMRFDPMNHAALFALCLAPSMIQAAPPDFVSKEELAAIQAEAESAKPRVEKINRSSAKILERDIATADAAKKDAVEFIKEGDIQTVATDESETEEAKPLQVEPGPNDTTINCDGGMYFDAENGILVYLKNVKVADPRFSLSGANELKVFFDKKEAADSEKKDGEKEGSIAPDASFGDVRKLVATGAVRILQKGVDGKEPVEASGAILTYDVASGEIIVSGGYPWVKQGKFYARAKQPNLTLRLLTDGSFSTEGNWEMGGNLNLKNR